MTPFSNAESATRGFIVDYVGLSNHLREALSIYASDDQKEILASLKKIDSELPILKARYQIMT